MIDQAFRHGTIWVGNAKSRQSERWIEPGVLLEPSAPSLRNGRAKLSTEANSIGYAAAAGSAALLVGAWGFQAFGYAPCAMCIWQRYPHAAAVAFGLLLLIGLRHPAVFILGAASSALTAGLGVYHTGVERDWWEGPSACTGAGLDLSTMSGTDLLSVEDAAPLVLCDEVVWEFLTLSMASWNVLLSLCLTCLWILALYRALSPRPAQLI